MRLRTFERLQNKENSRLFTKIKLYSTFKNNIYTLNAVQLVKKCEKFELKMKYTKVADEDVASFN